MNLLKIFVTFNKKLKWKDIYKRNHMWLSLVLKNYLLQHSSRINDNLCFLLPNTFYIEYAIWNTQNFHTRSLLLIDSLKLWESKAYRHCFFFESVIHPSHSSNVNGFFDLFSCLFFFVIIISFFSLYCRCFFASVRYYVGCRRYSVVLYGIGVRSTQSKRCNHMLGSLSTTVQR